MKGAIIVLLLVLRILLLILEGLSASEATEIISEDSGASFAALWAKLPDAYK